MSASIKRQSVT